MKSIIWKELRENLKWAVLAMIALGLAEFYVLSLQGSANYSAREISLSERTFLMVTSFGCAAVGAVLAAVQILPELRRDQWAALLHRPVPRQTIFFGKVIAGLLLYLLAAGGPLLMSVIDAALPGRFAGPLVPGMILPPLSDLALGVAFYFGALLISLHRGPWWGARGLLGLGLAPIFLLHLILPWLFVVPIAAALVLATAARAIMVSNGVVAEQSRFGRYSHILVLLLGAGCLLALFLIGLAIIHTYNGPSRPSYDFRLTAEGEVLVNTQQDDTNVLTYPDSDGKLVTDERYTGNNNYEYFRQFYEICDFRYGPEATDRYAAQQPRYSGNYYEQAIWNSYDGPENWFLLVGRDYFVGYDKLSRRQIGICDRDGFHPAGTTPRPFPERVRRAGWNSNEPYLYCAGKQLYSLDFSARSMRPILDAGDSRIRGAIGLRTETGKAVYFAVALDQEVRFLNLDGQLLGATPYTRSPNVWPDLSGGIPAKNDRIFLRYDRRNYMARNPDGHPQLCYVDELDLKGAVRHTYSMPADSFGVLPTTWKDRVAESSLPLLPTLLVAGANAIFAPKDSDIDDQPISVMPRDGLPKMIELQAATGLVLAAFAFFWGRRAGLEVGDLRRWSIFVFCFGLPGLLVFRLAAHWPTRVSCPHCAVRRPVETEECPACHSAWLAPLRNGTEIFE